MLSLEFGVLNARGIGDLSLWLQDADWRIETPRGWLGCNDEPCPLTEFMREIVGNTVEAVEVAAYGDLVVTFRDVVLRAFVVRHPREAGTEAWTLFGPNSSVSVTADPPYLIEEEEEEGSLQSGPSIPFIRNVESVFGKDAAKQLLKPSLEDLVLPDEEDCGKP